MRDAVATMGTLLPDEIKEGHRDAVHVAVIAATADEKLFPGQGVGYIDGRATPNVRAVGIVDPFLNHPVQNRERFWLYLFPRTITGLNHHWTHPAFDEAQPVTESETSMQWMQRYAEQYDMEASEMIEAAKDYLRTGSYLSRGAKFEGERVPDVFWDHYERITGIAIDDSRRGSFFTCSC